MLTPNQYVASDMPIGTRVRYVGTPQRRLLPMIGAEGTIIGYHGNNFLVEFDEEIESGHSGSFGVRGKRGHCWWFLRSEDDVVVVESAAISDESINELLFGSVDV